MVAFVFSRKIARALFLLLVCFSTSTTYALPKKKKRIPPIVESKLQSMAVKIANPHDGEGLFDYAPSKVSSFYDSATETILVTGGYVNVPYTWIRRAKVGFYVNGSNNPAQLLPNIRVRTKRKLQLASGSFSVRIPVAREPLWPTRPIVVEMADSRTGRVYARDRTMIYDLRTDAFTETDFPRQTPLIGMTAQLTDPGIGYISGGDSLTGFETAHLSTLPEPSLETFNSALSELARRIARYDDDNDKLKTCADLDALNEGRFHNAIAFPPYGEILGIAEAQKIAYDQRDTVCPALIQPAAIAACYLAAENLCVKETPEANDFELCVDQIEGEVTSHTIGAVDSVKLRFLDSNSNEQGLIKSHVQVSRLHATADGFIRDLSLRWKHGSCAPRPKVNVNDTLITEKDWLNEWATCHSMEMTHSRATTVTNDQYASFAVIRDPNDPEGLIVRQENPGTFSFFDPQIDAARGTCELEFMNPAATNMMESFLIPVQETVGNTWFAGAPRSQQAIALTRLFSTFGLGQLNIPSYDLRALVSSVSSSESEGMHIYWTTQIQPVEFDFINELNQGFFFELPGFSGATISAEGLDSLGHSFGISHSVTTGFLNQILNVRSATDKLYFQFRPTWGELAPFGVTIPAGASPQDLAVLNQSTLSQFDPAFQGFGRRELQIEVTPIHDPFAFMPSDVDNSTEIPNVGTPLAYGIDALRLTFKEPDRVVRNKTIKGTVWLDARLAFYDDHFLFGVDESENAKYFLPFLTHDRWTVTVVNSILKGCRMSLHDRAHGASCEARFEAKLAQLFEAELRPRFIELLSQVPAPQYFDAAGDADLAVQFTQGSRHQEAQYVTTFGDIAALP